MKKHYIMINYTHLYVIGDENTKIAESRFDYETFHRKIIVHSSFALCNTPNSVSAVSLIQFIKLDF